MSTNLDLQSVLEALGLPATASLDQVRKRVKKNAQHSSETDDWGTPLDYIEAARRTLGEIDFDACSSDYWNWHVVRAPRFYSTENSVLGNRLVGRGFGNPPGGKVPGTRRSLPKAVWEHVVEHWRTGDIDGFVWVGFSLEQLVMLQGCPVHPLQFATMVPCERIAYMQKDVHGGPPQKGESPTHGSFLTLLHTQRSPSEARAQAIRFRDEARRIGAALVRPLT